MSFDYKVTYRYNFPRRSDPTDGRRWCELNLSGDHIFYDGIFGDRFFVTSTDEEDITLLTIKFGKSNANDIY